MEKIVSAAVSVNGKIIQGINHSICITYCESLGLLNSSNDEINIKFGFYTSHDRFVTSSGAYTIAKLANQLKNVDHYPEVLTVDNVIFNI